MSEVTRLLDAAVDGDGRAAADLLPLVYDELRQLAATRLAEEKPGQTLQPTALVHEAYVRLLGGGAPPANWNGRGHFFAAAAEAMRRILVDNARRKKANKHGGRRQRVPLEEFHRVCESPDALLALDEVMTRFAAEEPEKANLVQLRFFGGLTIPEAAAALNISHATAERWWAYARVWLLSELQDEPEESAGREGSEADFSH